MTKEQAINYLKSSGFSDEQIEAVTEAFSEERKTGRWIEHDDFDNSWECSACNEVVDIIEGTPMDNEYRFCPWCGAKMEGSEADAEKL